jgi:Uma2 family endonuclease
MSTHEPETAPLILGKQDEGRPVTADEFATALFDEPWTYERAHGRLVVMSPEGTGHVTKASPWRDRLGAYNLAHPGIISVVTSQAWVRIDTDNDRIGDIGVYLVHEGRTLAIPGDPPDLIYEVVSPGRRNRQRDYVEKRADYHRVGVREYVIIDPAERRVTVLTHDAGGYHEQVLTMTDTYRTPLLPGFEVVLAEVL